MTKQLVFVSCLFVSVLATAQTGNIVAVDLGRSLGPMNINRFSVGQGGLSPDSMFADRVPEIRLLKPSVIRLFLQEYYEFLTKAGTYQFQKLDPSIDTILQTGAKPLLCMVFKPKVLFPAIDEDLAAPSSWIAWEDLVYHLVRHYRVRNGGGWYWEVGNEVDIESGGGTPYHMTPEQYTKFYEHTVKAIRRADPNARVGGPALAYLDSPIMAALLAFCDHNHVPLDFVSWHGYTDDPKSYRRMLDSMHQQLRQYPDLHPQTIIDEWNAAGEKVDDPRFQPAFIAETTYQMVEGGIDLSCYYHIRDYPFDADIFRKFYPEKYFVDQEKFWDRDVVYFGLFDYENQVRPAYFVFRLLERLSGDRLLVESNSDTVHALATFDRRLALSSILVWNFSSIPADVTVRLNHIPSTMDVSRFSLDAAGTGSSEMDRLGKRIEQKLTAGSGDVSLHLDPWGINMLSVGKD